MLKCLSKVTSFYFSEAIVSQVLDELGLQMADQLSGKFDPFDSAHTSPYIHGIGRADQCISSSDKLVLHKIS